MNLKSRQKKSSSRHSDSLKRVDSSSGYGSCSTLQNDPAGEFKKMKETLHNLFELAKTELNLIYKLVLNQIHELEPKFKEKNKITQQLVELINQIKKQAQMAMPDLPSKLSKILVVPIIIKKNKNNLNQQSLQYGFGHLKGQSRKKKNVASVKSLNKIDISAYDNEETLQRTSVKKIKSINVKTEDNLKFLEGEWPVLEAIKVQGKQIFKLCHFSQVKAHNLQTINFSNNEIYDLTCFRNANFPFLSELNLCKNKIKTLDGIQQANFPMLVILNLSHNIINNLKALKKSKFPVLLELNLEGNRLQNLQALSNCDFSNLQIINLDHNRLTTLNSLVQISFYRLRVMSFSYNAIASLEFLAKMSLKRLQALIGHNNKINSLQPLVYSNLIALKQIVLHNNEIADITCIKKMKFTQLTGFDIEYNKFDVGEIGCFMTNDKGYRQAKKKYPFILI